ncbi:hypothetical protein ABTX15_07980 [Micromonospora sp. NPDC094482]|uniref:hypothetical protein n=1 Tax=unclassified Micromonospora TaxID=2617518 RepID=UPI0033342261
MEFAMAAIYFVGFFIGMIILRARAGVGQGRIKVFGSDGFGPVWFTSQLVTLMFWPISLAIWLARGRPEPRVVFNHKAEERRRRRVAGA